MKKLLLSLLIILFSGMLNKVISQDSTYYITFRAGINNSDVNYGLEPLYSIFPRDDYLDFLGTGDTGLGYNLGLGFGWRISDRWELTTHFDYMVLNYESSAGVFNPRDGIGSPGRADIPVYLVGETSYKYLNIETGIRYYMGKKVGNGLFLGAFVSDMIHLSTDWNVLVRYEDYSVNFDPDFSEFQEAVDFNNAFFIGFNIGHKIKIGDKLTLAPLLDLRFGTNSIVKQEEGLYPMVFGVNVMATWPL